MCRCRLLLLLLLPQSDRTLKLCHAAFDLAPREPVLMGSCLRQVPAERSERQRPSYRRYLQHDPGPVTRSIFVAS